MRSIAIVTGSRADYGVSQALFHAIDADPDLRLQVIATGMHLSASHGSTVKMVEADGFTVTDRVDMHLEGDRPEDIARAMGTGVAGFSALFARHRPDILVAVGDRFEIHAAALACLPFAIPVAHVHGGEVTRGAFDDALRHSLSKLSHLDFVSTPEYAGRVMQLGEEDWRVAVVGALSLDSVRRVDLLDRTEMARRWPIVLADSFLLGTFHPVTLEYDQTPRQIDELLAAIEQSRWPVLFTMANADTYGSVINARIADVARRDPNVQFVDNLGTQGYVSAMAMATAMVGNSSSGMVEAAAFRLPVINVGTRQDGRLRTRNVIDVPCDRGAIAAGIHRATSPEFVASLEGLTSPYGDGRVAERIVARLKSVPLDAALIQKRFADHPMPRQATAGGPRTAG